MTPVAGALALTLFTGLTASASASFNPVVDVARVVHASASAAVLMPSPAGDVAYYTVVFKEAPLATYAGEVAGIPAPERQQRGAATGKLDLESAGAVAYVGYLESRQQSQIQAIEASLGRPLAVMARMQHALNAVIIGLDSIEAEELRNRDDVLFLEREHELELHTDRGPAFIGAPAIWTGDTASGVETQGEGIVVGIIDTGINWQSPAYAATGPIDGYVHQNPRGTGNYLGLCQTGFADAGRCNDKLIGMYNFASTAADRSGADTQGHGSHTSSTVAGNRWQATYASGQFTISGVAPHANVISYLACPSTCPSTATAQSVNQAVIDGVDVINYSISGGTSPWTDGTSVAFRNANAAGIFVAASAGNTSTTVPDPQGQTNHLEPWVETVAASTQDRIIAVNLDLDGTNPPANTQNIPMRPGGLPLPTSNLVNAPIIKSPNFANGATDGCAAYPANTFTRAYTPPIVPADRIFADGFDPATTPPDRVGAIAVLRLDGTTSTCGSGARRTAALNAGAIGVIFVDAAYLNLGAADTSWSMLTTDWNNLEAAMTPATATVSIDIAAQAYPGTPDVIAGFSFRGPRILNGQGMVKPDITGPGVDILAVGAANVVGQNGVYLNNGTSMSSPHLAGSAALLRALNPTWTPPQIKSALNLTSNNTGAINHDGTPVRPWDYGSGRVNLAKAAKVGLIMDETPANFLAANPAAGGDISSLNLASMARYNIVGTHTFTRTLRRARSGTQTYTLSVTGLPAGAATFTPASFTVNSSGSRTITVSVVSGLLTPSQWTFGELTLTPSGGDEPPLHMPIAVYPGGPAIAVTPASLSGASDTTVSNNLTISNTANPTLNWQVQTTGTGTLTPINTTSTTNGWQGGTYSGFTPARGYHWSQNFDVTTPLRVTTLRANGFTLPSTTALSTTNTPSITFSVYADNAGVPAGAPEGFGAAPLWTFTGAISTANGITTTGGSLALNLNAANVSGTPLNLTSGRYWLTVTPTINGTGAQNAANPLWAWYVSGDTQVGNVPRLYAPWQNPTQFQTGDGLNMLSTFVQGVADCTLPAWASLATTSGALGFNGSQTVPVTFNASGLSAGTYTGSLCISSNATNQPVVVVPLSFNVPNGGAMAPSLSKAFAPASVSTGATSTLTITLSNPGPTAATLDAALTDTFPTGLVVAATPNAATTCASGTVTAAAGAGSVSLASGAQIGAAGSCTVTVDVTASTVGSYENVLAAGALSTDAGDNGTAATATLAVTAPPLPTCPAQTFDDVTAPELPAGWTYVDGGTSTGAWTTVTTFADTAPNAAFSPNSATLADRSLVSPAFSPTPGSAVSFRHRYSLESGYDGGVLEISINGGAYQDIVAAGGSFASGGYTAAISAGFGSAIGGRQAWTGTTTGAFITSSAILPASAANQPVRLRWRESDDSSGTGTAPAGWWVDSVTCGAAPPTVTKAFSPTVTTAGQPTTLTISLNHPASSTTLTADLVDTFPANLVVAATPNASTTCPSGTVTAAAGAGTVTLAAGAQIPTTGCTVTVSATASAGGYYTNTIAAGALQTDSGNSPAAATATYRALAPAAAPYSTGFESPFTTGTLNGQQGWTSTAANAVVSAVAPAAGTQHVRLTSTAATSGNPVSGFAPTQVPAEGAYSLLSAKLRLTRTTNGATWEFNPQDPASGVVSTLIRFDKGAARQIQIPNFVTGLFEPTGASWPLAEYFTLSVAFNRAARTMEVCVNGTSIYSGSNGVSSPYIGNLVARQVGQASTTAGNTFDIDDFSVGASDTAPVCAPPAPTVSKTFAPVGVETATPSVLTINLGNTASTAATLTQALTDTFPSGLVVAPTPNASTTCTGGALTAAAGAGSVSLASGAQIPPGGCSVTVSVQSATAQDYTNTIAAGALQTTNGNNVAAGSAVLMVGNLIVNSGPLSIVVPADSNGVYFDWLAGTNSTTQTTGSAFNPYGTTLQFFWPNTATLGSAGVSVTAGGTFRVLASGDTINASSLFSTAGTTAAAANFRNAAGVDGYLGFRFTNTTVTPNIVTYGYVHLQTAAGTTGHPATVLGYAYNRAGLPITIP